MSAALSTPLNLPIDAIHVAPGHNPRTYFKPSAFERLVDSIRAEGLIQAITVRPNPNGEGYELISGERRLRACRLLQFSEVPSLVREVDDITARRFALLENLDRENLGVSDEARSAQAHVDAYEGDHDAAARALGWGVQKLKHRLRLLHCVEEVMQSLAEEKLTLAHAELLATLPEDAQRKVLPRILERDVGVAELKEQLNGFAMPLAQAVFDRDVAGCGTCPYNSSLQASLFSNTIDGAKCTNRQCFGSNTQAALEAKRTALREEFGTVAFLTEKVPGATIPLILHGEGGVGSAQFEKCRACAFRGAVIDDRLGATTGKVDQPLCFDRPCNALMVEAHRETLVPMGQDGTEADAPASATAPAAKGASATATKGKSKAAPKAAAKATPAAVANQHAAIVRRALTARLQSDPTPVLALALYGLARAVAEESGREGVEAVAKSLGVPPAKSKTVGRHTTLAAAMARMDKPALQQAIVAAACALFERHCDDTPFNRRVDRRALAALLVTQSQVDILPHVRIDAEFLAAHTKAAIEAMLTESGFSAWMKEQPEGEKKLRALLASGKPDLVKGVLAAGFPGFQSYLPSALSDQVAAWRASA